MRKYLSILFVALLLTLAACGDDVEKKSVSSVESSDKNEEASDEQEESQEESKDFNEVIVDNDNLKVTLISVAKVEDKEWDEERYEVNFEIINKRDDTIEVQAHEVSADGKMIDDLVAFSETVSGGKEADAIMVIENYDGDLPEIKEDLEFVLDVFSYDEDYEEQQDVKIEFD